MEKKLVHRESILSDAYGNYGLEFSQIIIRMIRGIVRVICSKRLKRSLPPAQHPIKTSAHIACTTFQIPPKDEIRRQKMMLSITGISVILVSIPNLVLILNEWNAPTINALAVGESKGSASIQCTTSVAEPFSEVWLVEVSVTACTLLIRHFHL